MEKILKIEGMMCPHCEGRVKQALEETNGVISAVASHESGTATVTLSKEVDTDILQKVVEAQGYTVIND